MRSIQDWNRLKKYSVSPIAQKAIGFCGPATLSMLFSVFGIKITQEEIMMQIGIHPMNYEEGTRIDQLAQAVEELIKDYILLGKYNSNIVEITNLFKAFQIPVGTEWQGTFFDERGVEFNEGHYSVIKDIDYLNSKLTIIDPDHNSIFNTGYININEFRKRWWDRNKVTFSVNGTEFTEYILNKKLIFIVIPRITRDLFLPLGFHIVSKEFMIKNRIE